MAPVLAQAQHLVALPRPEAPVLAGLLVDIPRRLDAVSDDPRSVLKSEILVLT